MQKFIRVTMFREGTTTDGKLISFLVNEEETRDYINRVISEALDWPHKLRWRDYLNGAGAVSQTIVIKSFKFKDTTPQRYFLFADDVEASGARCSCGQVATLTYGYSGYACSLCGASFYINHCWSCGSTVDSRTHKRCGCGGYICNCKACSQGCQIRRPLR